MSLAAPIKLSHATLSGLQGEIRVPSYNRSALLQHTVHIGVGGFHRAHQAVYLDDLLAMRDMPRWGECGLGVLESDVRMRDALLGQDCLYTVLERSAEQQTARVIGSMTDYLFAPAQREAAIEKMASADTRIVSLTITEGGYFLHEGTGQFTAEHPAIQHDLAHPEEPASWLGLISAALHRRRQRGLPAFTVMSCDNLQGNGDVARRVLLSYAGLGDTALQRWIAANAAFPNSMVDRITPATTKADTLFLAERFGLEDAWPVVTEPFRQWVIEDTFVNGRPEWERAGAEIVADVAPYELMKMRLLNGSHMAMAYLGALAGYTYVHEIMQDPLFQRFIEAFMEEVTPVVPKIPGTSIPEYKVSLIERFSNPTIRDQVTRICSEGSAKLPKWVLPSIVELLQGRGEIRLLNLVIASWIQYLQRGVDERGATLEIIDARGGELTALARKIGTDPRPMLGLSSVFGDVLPAQSAFVIGVEKQLRNLSRLGIKDAVRFSLDSR